MKVSKAISLYREYQLATHKTGTIRGYNYVLNLLEKLYANNDVETLTTSDISSFLEFLTNGYSQGTKHLRFTQTKAFFNFIIEKADLNIKNPCDTPILNKMYRGTKRETGDIVDKEKIDEIIYRTQNQRNRLVLELQARCGLRVGEVLKLRPRDINGRKISISGPKSGKTAECAFMPEPVANRLQRYIAEKCIPENATIFKLSYSGARSIVKRLGEQIGVTLKPHDLRKHSATWASRNGVPLEIISKVILRHRDLRTTQIYLGKVSDTEAIRWLDMLYGK